MRSRRIWTLLAVSMASAVASAALTITFAGAGSVVTTAAGKGVTQVKVARGASAGTDSTTYEDLHGAVLKVKVPKKQRAILLVRYAAAAACSTQACSLRVLVDGKQAQPGEVTFEPEDTTLAHTFEWSTGRLGPGSHTVKVQGAVQSGGQLSITRWHLAVERVRA